MIAAVTLDDLSLGRTDLRLLSMDGPGPDLGWDGSAESESESA